MSHHHTINIDDNKKKTERHDKKKMFYCHNQHHHHLTKYHFIENYCLKRWRWCNNIPLSLITTIFVLLSCHVSFASNFRTNTHTPIRQIYIRNASQTMTETQKYGKKETQKFMKNRFHL